MDRLPINIWHIPNAVIYLHVIEKFVYIVVLGPNMTLAFVEPIRVEGRLSNPLQDTLWHLPCFKMMIIFEKVRTDIDFIKITLNIILH